MTKPDRVIRLKTVVNLTGLSRSTVYRKIKMGTFPSQFKISDQCSGWHESDVLTWVANPKFYEAKDFPSIHSNPA